MYNCNRLRQRRLDMGLTLEEVGNVVGISRSAVQKHEKGIIKNVYISTIELFAKALHCSPAYLMGWTDIPIDSPDKLSASSEESDMIFKYRTLDQRGRAAVLDTLNREAAYISTKSETAAAIAEDVVETVRSLSGDIPTTLNQNVLKR